MHAIMASKVLSHSNNSCASFYCNMTDNLFCILHDSKTITILFFNLKCFLTSPVDQLVLWSWRVPLFLWWRVTLWLWAAEARWPPALKLISIKMASSSGTALQERWLSTKFPSLMKDSTSVTSLELESQQRAGWLSEVRDNSVASFYTDHAVYIVCVFVIRAPARINCFIKLSHILYIKAEVGNLYKTNF